jgi:N-methylhydantoinase B
MFNSGGAGARPMLDGLSATAFPSGVMTMPVEATEQAGPVIVWCKELRLDSGGAGQFRGGLGQVMEVGARDGHEFDFQAMFDRLHHPARGRNGGAAGAPTTIARSDGSAMKGKGKQFVPHGHIVKMAFPCGAGYGPPELRDPALVMRDLAMGYITKDTARSVYGLTSAQIATAMDAALTGDDL